MAQQGISFQRGVLRPLAVGSALSVTALVAGAAIGLADGEPLDTRAAPATQLVCTGTLTVGFTPAISTTMRDVAVAGNGVLDNCYSPDHSQNGLKSARVEFSGSTRTSCQQPQIGAGQVRITWYSQPGLGGAEAGSTVFNGGSAQPGAGGGAFGEMRGVAAPGSSAMPNAAATVSAAVPGDFRRCAAEGIPGATGTVTASFDRR